MENTKFVTLDETVNLKALKQEVELIKEAQAEGLSKDKIQRLLQLQQHPDEIFAEYEKYEKYCTVEEALERINKETNRKISMKRPTLLKLIRSEVIAADRGSKRHGFFIVKDSLNKFIEQQNLTKDDLLEQLKQAHERIAELEQQLADAPKASRRKSK